MKKIFSLFIIAAMILTMSITSFAATVSGMKTTITETDTDITVTVTVGDVTSMSGVTSYLKFDTTNKATYVADSVEAGSAVSNWKITPSTDKSGYIKFVIGTTDESNYITTSGDLEVLSYKIAKVSSDVELSASDFTYGTGTLDVSKITCTASGFYSAKNPTSKTATDAFTVEYVDKRTKAGWTETDGTTTVTVKFPTSATEKAGDESSWTGNASTQASKKAVKFGKNETGSLMKGATVSDGKLVVNNPEYYVEYNGEKYYGLIDVEAGKSWAILIIESAN